MKCKNLVAKYCAIDNRGYPKNEHELLKLILLVSASHHWLIKSPFTEGDQWWVGLTPKGVTGWNGRPDIYVSAPTLTDAICEAVILIWKAPNGVTPCGVK